MDQRRATLAFVNVGHTYDHLFMLLYPTVVLALEHEFADSYGSLLSLSLVGFIAFGAGTLPAGWLGDRWSRTGMLAVFFFGIGGAAVLTGLARTPFEIAAGLGLIGLFAAIYHPVGTTLVVADASRVGRSLGVNGFFGNLGVAAAALVAGALTDLVSWRAAFIVPGLVAVATGIAFVALVHGRRRGRAVAPPTSTHITLDRAVMRRVIAVLVVATLCGGLVFNATTIAMPKLFEERLTSLATTTFGIGGLASAVYLVAAFAQILVGNLIDRFPFKPIFLAVVAVQAVALLAFAGLRDLPLFVMAFVVMSLVFGEIPLHDTLVARHTAEAWRARVYALKYVLSLGVSALTVPLVALIHDHAAGGFTTLILVLAGLAVVILVSVLWLPDTRAVAARAGRSLPSESALG